MRAAGATPERREPQRLTSACLLQPPLARRRVGCAPIIWRINCTGSFEVLGPGLWLTVHQASFVFPKWTPTSCPAKAANDVSAHRSPLQCYALLIAKKAFVIRTYRRTGIARLNGVILPIADGADVVAANGFLEGEKATRDAGIQFHCSFAPSLRANAQGQLRAILL